MIHEGDSHEIIANSIIGAISDHLIMNKGVLHPNQLVPGDSILNEHIRNGKMPGGAEGEAIRKRNEKKLAELKEIEEQHVIK